MIVDFAKLFKVDGIGQILVVLDTNSSIGCPEIKFSITPHDLGVCSAATRFTNDDAGWNAAEAAFEQVTQERAVDFVTKSILDLIKGARP